MPTFATLAVVLLVLGFAAPAAAYDNATNYNFKNAPPGQQRGEEAASTSNNEADIPKSSAAEEEDEPALAPPKQELSTPQKEAKERRRITGEGSDVFHGDEEQWPHNGRMH